jgi:hypothetical protein
LKHIALLFHNSPDNGFGIPLNALQNFAPNDYKGALTYLNVFDPDGGWKKQTYHKVRFIELQTMYGLGINKIVEATFDVEALIKDFFSPIPLWPQMTQSEPEIMALCNHTFLRKDDDTFLFMNTFSKD